MNESNLWEWLRDVALPLGHYSRIESPDTAPGFPDVFFTVGQGPRQTSKPPTLGGAGCGTIELKANLRPSTVPFPDEEKGLHTSQKKWIKGNIKEGGVCWIIAEVPGCIYIIHGKDAENFNGANHEELSDMAWNIISRDDPKGAVTVLDGALRTPSNFRLFGDFYA